MAKKPNIAAQESQRQAQRLEPLARRKLPGPIQITMYDANDEPIETYSRTRVPTEILLQAMDLSEELETFDQDNAGAAEVRQMLETLGAFIVEVFGAQFTLGELLKTTEMNDMITVVTAVANRAQGIAEANPTSPRDRTTTPTRK